MLIEKINLLGMSRKELQIFFYKLGEKSFRADQVMRWIYHYYCDDFSKMMNLNKSLRLKLNMIAEIRAPEIAKQQISYDGTIKWAMKIGHQQVETVYIPEYKRSTICISSQIGCALQCSFCGTGQQGFNRNLYISEIIGQIWRVGRIIFFNKKCINEKFRCAIPITHVVFMGMGEPLLNLMNVVASINIISDDFGFGISKKHIVISTAGVVPGINKLKDMVDVILAVSLHAPNDSIRNKIMPINKRYNMHDLFQSIRYYMEGSIANRGRVTIEYILLYHVNDEVFHAHQLAKKLKFIPCKVNLIPWNYISNTSYSCSTFVRMHNFLKILLQYRIMVIIRKIRGVDIDAACGQLTGSVINRTRSFLMCQNKQQKK